MQGIEYFFEELEPEGYPGVMVEGWATVEADYDDEWYVEDVYVGSKGNNKKLPRTDPLWLAINKTLTGRYWEGYVWDALKKYNEE